MNILKSFGILMLVFFVTGCAVGNQYDYGTTEVSLPLVGDGELGVGALERRPYVLDGDKDPDFVGLQRGGFNNPFDVSTASGNPLVDDMSNALQNALRNSGYTVSSLEFDWSDTSAIASALAKTGKAKNIVLVVTEWKTDVFMNMTLHFDLTLHVVSKDGAKLAENRTQGSEELSGAGFESQNSRLAADAFETKIGRMFNNPEIQTALQN